MDQTNTSQAGQDTQSLQPGGSQTQGSASPLQTGSGAGLAGNDSSDLLNQGVPVNSLSVGVAGSNSRTSTAPPANVASVNPGIPGFFALIPLVMLLFALVLAYNRIRKFDKDAEENTPPEEISEDLTWTTKDKNKKKKRKKPKKPHHH